MDEEPQTPESKPAKRTMKERWANYQPNKNSLYKAVGYSVFLTVALGFTLGGWHTSGAAQELARDSRIDYAAQLCADKFKAADTSGEKLAEFKTVEGHYQRRHALKDGDWVMAPSGASEEFIDAVTFRCGERLFSSEAGGDEVMAESKSS